jgi:hypothetical protein
MLSLSTFALIIRVFIAVLEQVLRICSLDNHQHVDNLAKLQEQIDKWHA